jgi:1A family penicillin-binding protein
MPIPYLRNQKREPSWRNHKKKYFITRKKESSRSRDGHLRKTAGLFGGWLKFNLTQKKLWQYLFIFIILVSISVVGLFVWVSRDLPDPNKLIERQIAQSTKIYDRTGETVLYEISGEQKRTLVNLKDVPDYVKQATIAIEDKDFYKHGAISFWGIFRGVIVRVMMGKSPQGGSTLTQQFVKNAILTSERSIIRKVKEWILSYRLEKRFSKDEILQMYLNEIPYGSTAYGVQAASQKYFAKNVQNVNLAEAAILAALPQAPSRYSPYGPNRDALIARQKYILDIMVNQGYITQEQADEAKAFKLEFKQLTDKFMAPHFVMYVKELLSEKYGEKTVEQGGLKIYTTLDLYKQNAAEEAIAEIAPENEKKYNATNASLVSIDPKTGQILAMVGSRDYFDEKIDGQVNIATSNRQPGSSLKPVVYAAAFIKGYTPNTILYDVVTNFSTDPSKPYEPHNYDGQEHGPIPMKRALGGSLNIPAVKTIYLAGIDNVLDLTQELGYSTFGDRSRFGLSLVLGGGEVKLLEHVNAYGAFAREGIAHPITAILKVEDKDGKVLEEFTPTEKRAMDPKIARLINDILSDNSNRAWIFGEKNYLTLGNRPVAAKTGTTNDFHDAWTVGYTPSIVAGVWVGNSDNTAMKKGADGSVLAAPIWNKYMKKILGDTPIEYFTKPEIPMTGKPVLDGQIGQESKIKIDRASGLLATEYTPASFIEEVSFAKPHCILYYVNKDNPLGPAPENPEADPQFNLWESRVVAWAEKNGYATSTDAGPPTAYDNLHTPENLPQLYITKPDNNEIITNSILVAQIEATAPRGINRAEYYVNDNLLTVNSSYPFGLEKRIDFMPNGFYNLKVMACDDIDNCTTKNVEFNLILPTNQIYKELNVKLIEPTNGLAVSNIDFPLSIRVNVNNPGQVAKANFFYQNEIDKITIPITTVQKIIGNEIVGVWEKIPTSGNYKIYCEIITWDKKTQKSVSANLVINNTETPNP